MVDHSWFLKLVTWHASDHKGKGRSSGQHLVHAILLTLPDMNVLGCQGMIQPPDPCLRSNL
ncbi:hypothetical protein SADUNF_Sadunf11G0066500 [Salix dunnii]|uniref:Uncharacterized protein n=1 Tax=Salix dunnii TaxID=1413687 RepID=A0A835JQA2_9ROSI|nr:hypothetical protein SADUNF_Sadunf11G0066500 [Salix dunnii]